MVLSNYRMGWNEEFERYPGMRLEYIPLDVAWKAAYYAGLRERYPHFFAKSGFFAFFLYDLDKFWVYDLFRMVLVDNALTACNVKRTTFDPGNVNEAIQFMDDMVKRGNLVWVSWMEPLLVYGIEPSGKIMLIHWHNPAFAPDGTTWGTDELEGWWQWADFEGAHLMISPSGVVPGTNPDEQVLIELAKMVAQNAAYPEIEMGENKIRSGINAYNAYIDDLRNPKVDFLLAGDDGEQHRRSWFCFAIYSQWTQLFAAHTYLISVASIFPDKQKDALRSAAQHYSAAYGYWLKWEEIIGRHPDEATFVARIGDMKSRIAAAEQVERARDEVAKAVEAIKEFLDLRGVSLDEENNDANAAKEK